MISRRRLEQHAAILACLSGCALLLSAAPMRAQSPTEGALRGIVADTARHPIPSAFVTLQDLDTAASHTTLVRRDGTFLIPLLPPGAYRFTVSAPSLPPASYAPLQISAGETLDLRASFPRPPFRGTLQLLSPNQPEPSAQLPDQNDDGLPSAGGLNSLQNASLLDGVSATQSFLSVPAGTGSRPRARPRLGQLTPPTSPPAPPTASPADATPAPPTPSRSPPSARSASPATATPPRPETRPASSPPPSPAPEPPPSTALPPLPCAPSSSPPPTRLPSPPPSPTASPRASSVKPHDLRESVRRHPRRPYPPHPRSLFLLRLRRPAPRLPRHLLPRRPQLLRPHRHPTRPARQPRRHRHRPQHRPHIISPPSPAPLPAAPTNRSTSLRVDWRPAPPPHPLRRGQRRPLDRPRRPHRRPRRRPRPRLPRQRQRLASIPSSSAPPPASPRAPSTRPASPSSATSSTRRPKPRSRRSPPSPPAASPPRSTSAPTASCSAPPPRSPQAAYPDERRIELADTLTLARGRHLLALGGDRLLRARYASPPSPTPPAPSATTAAPPTAPPAASSTSSPTAPSTSTSSPTAPAPASPPPPISSASTALPSFGLQRTAFSTQEWSAFAEDTWRLRPASPSTSALRYEYTLLPIPATPNPTLDALFAPAAPPPSSPKTATTSPPRLPRLAALRLGLTVRAGYGLFSGRLPGATLRAALTDTAQPPSTTRIRILPPPSSPAPRSPRRASATPAPSSAQPTGASPRPPPPSSSTAASACPSSSRAASRSSAPSARRTLHRRLPAQSRPPAPRLHRPQHRPLHRDRATSSFSGGTGAPGVQDGETFSAPALHRAPHSALRPRHRHHLAQQRHLQRAPAHRRLRPRRTLLASAPTTPGPRPSTTRPAHPPPPAPTPSSTPSPTATTRACPRSTSPGPLRVTATWRPQPPRTAP